MPKNFKLITYNKIKTKTIKNYNKSASFFITRTILGVRSVLFPYVFLIFFCFFFSLSFLLWMVIVCFEGLKFSEYAKYWIGCLVYNRINALQLRIIVYRQCWWSNLLRLFLIFVIILLYFFIASKLFLKLLLWKLWWRLQDTLFVLEINEKDIKVYCTFKKIR
jgi:hypothetical protein